MDDPIHQQDRHRHRFVYPEGEIVILKVAPDKLNRLPVDILAPSGGFLGRDMLNLWLEADRKRLAGQAGTRDGVSAAEWGDRLLAVSGALEPPIRDPSPEVDAPDEEVAPTPPFPEAAWTGLFSTYRDLVGPTTEAPDVYHFFCFATVFGATLGRRLAVYHANLLYPNFFVALVGRTAIARKDTARNRATKLLLELNHELDMNYEDGSDPKFIMVPGVGSAEGLIDTLGGNGKVVVVQQAELLSLMMKARREATSNLIPHLTELYDCPDHYSLKTRVRPVKCQDTFLSLLCGTTPVWLRQSLTEELAQGGFANRFIFAFGDPKPPIAFPARIDAGNWAHLVEDVNQVRLWADNHGPELPVDEMAREMFTQWYTGYHPRASGEGLLPALSVRFQTFAWKFALLYAAQSQHDHITQDHLSPAISVVDWLWESNQAAFVNFVGHGRGLEDAIIDRLRQRENHFLTARTLYRALKVSAKELEGAAEPMVRLGLLQKRTIPGSHGPSPEGYQLIT